MSKVFSFLIGIFISCSFLFVTHAFGKDAQLAFSAKEKKELKSKYRVLKDLYFEYSLPMITGPITYNGNGSDKSYVDYYNAINRNPFYFSGSYTISDIGSYTKGKELIEKGIKPMKVNLNKALVYFTTGGVCIIGGLESGLASCIPLAIVIEKDIAISQIKESVKKGRVSCADARMLEILDVVTDIIMADISIKYKAGVSYLTGSALSATQKMEMTSDGAAIIDSYSTLVDSEVCSNDGGNLNITASGKLPNSKGDFVMHMTLAKNTSKVNVITQVSRKNASRADAVTFTGIMLKKGDIVELNIIGSASGGPNFRYFDADGVPSGSTVTGSMSGPQSGGRFPNIDGNANIYSIIGTVSSREHAVDRETRWFPVGKHKKFTSAQDGELILLFNDALFDLDRGAYYDNSGTFAAEINVNNEGR